MSESLDKIDNSRIRFFGKNESEFSSRWAGNGFLIGSGKTIAFYLAHLAFEYFEVKGGLAKEYVDFVNEYPKIFWTAGAAYAVFSTVLGFVLGRRKGKKLDELVD